MPQSLTILICTHDRAALLEKVLASLDACERAAELAVDVLVVANACSDETHAFLKRRTQESGSVGRLPLRWLVEPLPGKSHALNTGAAALRGDWVAIVDDDQRASIDYLVRVEQAIATHPAATLLCGRILPDWDGREPAWVHETGAYRIYPLPIPLQDFGSACRELGVEGPIPGGGNHILQVGVLRRTGRFSTELGPRGHDLGGGEDTDYILRALRAGERLWYVPGIVQYHHVDPARLVLRYLLRKAYRRSAAAVALNAVPGRASGVPLYLFRKLAAYALGALLSVGSARRRFYLVRSAAALGEMAGHRRRARSGAATATLPGRSGHA